MPINSHLRSAAHARYCFANLPAMVVRSTEAEVLRYMLFSWWIERFVQWPKHFDDLKA